MLENQCETLWTYVGNVEVKIRSDYYEGQGWEREGPVRVSRALYGDKY